jgi:hypothetical protein
MLKNSSLLKTGLILKTFPLVDQVMAHVQNEDWIGLDKEIKNLTHNGGELFKFLHHYHDFNEIEFIISIRDAENEWEEDGIWHDDGSRVLAFSLSLSIHSNQIQGGRLGIRRKGEERAEEIPTPEYGTLIIFLTGVYGFEHKIHQVTKGKRIIIAGWCS